MTGAVVRSSVRAKAEISSDRDVSGSGAQVTLKSSRCNWTTTRCQQEPSAHAPCTRTMVRSREWAVIVGSCLLPSGSRYHGRRESLSSRSQFLRRESLSQGAQYRPHSYRCWIGVSVSGCVVLRMTEINAWAAATFGETLRL